MPRKLFRTSCWPVLCYLLKGQIVVYVEKLINLNLAQNVFKPTHYYSSILGCICPRTFLSNKGFTFVNFAITLSPGIFYLCSSFQTIELLALKFVCIEFIFPARV